MKPLYLLPLSPPSSLCSLERGEDRRGDEGREEERKEELAQRIRENLPKTEKIKKLDELEDNIIFDTSGSASDIQLNKSRDFGTMSKNELRQATDVIRNLSIHLPQKQLTMIWV